MIRILSELQGSLNDILRSSDSLHATSLHLKRSWLQWGANLKKDSTHVMTQSVHIAWRMPRLPLWFWEAQRVSCMRRSIVCAIGGRRLVQFKFVSFVRSRVPRFARHSRVYRGSSSSTPITKRLSYKKCVMRCMGKQRRSLDSMSELAESR